MTLRAFLDFILDINFINVFRDLTALLSSRFVVIIAFFGLIIIIFGFTFFVLNEIWDWKFFKNTDSIYLESKKSSLPKKILLTVLWIVWILWAPIAAYFE
jgi:hypothetical protein